MGIEKIIKKLFKKDERKKTPCCGEVKEIETPTITSGPKEIIYKHSEKKPHKKVYVEVERMKEYREDQLTTIKYFLKSEVDDYRVNVSHFGELKFDKKRNFKNTCNILKDCVNKAREAIERDYKVRVEEYKKKHNLPEGAKDPEIEVVLTLPPYFSVL